MISNNYQLRRVVVTGIGLVTPLGIGVKNNWERLIEGNSAVRQLEKEDLPEKHQKFFDALQSRVVACVSKIELNACPWRPTTDSRRVLSFVDYAETAAAEALSDSKVLNWIKMDKSRIGVSVGVGMSGTGEIASTWDLLVSSSPRKMSPYFVSKILPNTASGNISVRYGLTGPNISSSAACAAGAHAIGDAFHLIQNGHSDVMIAGGSESCIDATAFLGFGKMKALSTSFNETPNLASRPFDKKRDGFVMGEGAGIMILEEMDHALERQATIYAEIVGYGLSGDGYHITHPQPQGDGAYLAMLSAIKRSRLNLDDFTYYINAHATSTPVGDIIELRAIQKLFEDALHMRGRFYVSSSKGAIGHLLGAAGAVECIFSVLSLKRRNILGTVNLENPEVDLEYLLRPGTHVMKEESIAMLSNSFGFGGTNASLLFTLFENR